MLVVLDEGRSIAQAAGETAIGTEHALGALGERGVSTAAILRRYSISRETLASRLSTQAQVKRVSGQDAVAQAKAGEGVPVYVRVDLMRDLLGLLTLANHRHVILVGDAGVGRRSLVNALSLLMAEGKGPVGLTKLVQVTENALLVDAEKAIDSAYQQARDGILFIPNIERFFGSAMSSPEFPKATRPVQRAFLSLSPVVIASTTDAAWNERLAVDSVVRENSHRMRVPEPTIDETVAILGVHRSRLEHDYGLKIADNALPAAATMAKRYVAGAPLPASALAALHRAGALLKLAGQSSVAFRPDLQPDSELDADDVAVAVSVMTGIPVSKLGVDERARYAHMVEALHQRIIGQDEAVLAVSRAVKIARVGLKDPKRPIGSFLFLGPTGVGKTELAKALAEFMFGSEDAMVVLDMSEYQQDHTVNRLIGAPPGYVGYEGGGQLTEKVRQRPSTVVLFDEVEKAHPARARRAAADHGGRPADRCAGPDRVVQRDGDHPDQQPGLGVPGPAGDDRRDARPGDGGRAVHAAAGVPQPPGRDHHVPAADARAVAPDPGPAAEEGSQAAGGAGRDAGDQRGGERLDAGAERSPRVGRTPAAPHHPEEPARAAGRLDPQHRAAEGREGGGGCGRAAGWCSVIDGRKSASESVADVREPERC